MPTIAEAGGAGFDYEIWYGIWVRAGTPPGVVDKLAKDITHVLATSDLRDSLAKPLGSNLTRHNLHNTRLP